MLLQGKIVFISMEREVKSTVVHSECLVQKVANLR